MKAAEDSGIGQTWLKLCDVGQTTFLGSGFSTAVEGNITL